MADIKPPPTIPRPRWRVAAREVKGTLRRLTKPSAERRLRRYVDAGRVPWSDGYGVYKTRLVTETLADASLMERFRRGESLPAGFGHGVDERCVEYPWVFARLPVGEARVLDAGSALNFAHLLSLPVWQGKPLDIVTLGPEANCFWRRGISYLYDDLRRLPLRDSLYDHVISISTLEHVGFDNREFAEGEHDRDRPEEVHKAVAELARVLKPAGSALLTVPYGVAERFHGHQVFDAHGLTALIEAFGPARVSTTYYRYDEQGWQCTDAKACEDRRFVDWISRPPAERARTPFPMQADNAAASRAVACVELVKSR